MAIPTIEELVETAKQRLSDLTQCCGFRAAEQCRRCVASQKIVDAYERYENARVNDWPEEIPACDKCGSMSRVGKWGVGETGPIFDLCEMCHSDTDGFTEWLAGEIRDALDNDPNYELQPDGIYKFVGQEAN